MEAGTGTHGNAGLGNARGARSVRDKEALKFVLCGGADSMDGATSGRVAVVINSRWRNCVEDVEPVSDRALVVTLMGSPTVRLIGCYAPTAQHTTAVNVRFYRGSKKALEDGGGYSVYYIMRGVNARAQAAQAGEEGGWARIRSARAWTHCTRR